MKPFIAACGYDWAFAVYIYDPCGGDHLPTRFHFCLFGSFSSGNVQCCRFMALVEHLGIYCLFVFFVSEGRWSTLI